MSQHENILKRFLQEDVELPRFSLRGLAFPASPQAHHRNWFREQLNKAGFAAPSFDFLPFVIEIPIPIRLDTGAPDKRCAFVKLAQRALTLEQKLCNAIRDSRDQMRTALGDVLESEIAQRPMTANIIQRLKALAEHGVQVVPGIYLGTLGEGCAIRENFAFQLAAAWSKVDPLAEKSRSSKAEPFIPKDVLELADEWSDVQRMARSAIIESTWNAAVSRSSWPVPAAFSEFMCLFLEGKSPEPVSSLNSLCERPDKEFWKSFSLLESGDEAALKEKFGVWWDQIEHLAASSSRSRSLSIVNSLESLSSGGERSVPVELSEQFRDEDEPRRLWEEFVRDPRSVDPRILAQELFPAPLNPYEVHFDSRGIPCHIVISEPEAINYGSRYMSNFAPREFTILYSQEFRDSLWSTFERTKQCQALSLSPLAQFISNIVVDCSGLSEAECLDEFRDRLKLLRALEDNDAWRNTSTSHSLTLSFENITFKARSLLTLECLESNDDLDAWVIHTASEESAFGGLVHFRIPLSLRSPAEQE